MSKPQRSLLVFLAIVAVGDFILNIYGIQFPYYWHPDEIGKVNQVITGVYNFYHPQLMLHLAWLAKKLFGVSDTVREVVISGRLVSAAATAIATAAFAAIVVRRHGIVFGVATAAMVALTPSVFLNAHYFKEDATLLIGVALTMLAMQNVEANPSRKNILFLGLALGLTCSAKYIGAFMVVPVVAILAFRVRVIQIAYCLGLAALVFLIVNSPGLFGQSNLTRGLTVEFRHVTTSHGGVAWGPTSLGSLKMFMASAPLVIVGLWLIGLALSLAASSRASEKKRLSFENLLFLTPVALLIVNQFSMVLSPRYFLAATVLVTVSAIWTVANLTATAHRPVVRYASMALLAIGRTSIFWSFSATASVFRKDPRGELATWVANNLPMDAKIAEDFYSGLPTPERVALDPAIPKLPQSITMVYFQMGLAGSLEALREKGYTHLVISSGGFDRFYDPTATLGPEARNQKKFFDEVFRTLKPIHEVPKQADVDSMLSTRILVYDIRN